MVTPKVFENAQFGKVRTIKRGEEILFVAADVCRALDLSNPRQAVARLDDDEKNSVAIRDGIGNPNQVIIDEAGLYSLILRSKLPQAEAFQEWVVSEVLPAIRKTGQYGAALKSQVQVGLRWFKIKILT